MGINPTPTNHRSFTFDGKSTREFGVYITGEGVFNAPERAVEMISIPGRDGEYALDQGHFNNIEVTYRAGIVSDSTTDFAEAMSDFRNWLASHKGYFRLTDEYNPDEYRMAVFKNVITVEHEGLETGEFDVVFNCKPQRWLTSGETAITVTSGDDITNPTLFDSAPLLAVDGYGEIKFNNRSIAKIENIEMGYTVVADNVTISNASQLVATIQDGTFENGDTITIEIDNIRNSVRYLAGLLNTLPTASDSNSDFSTIVDGSRYGNTYVNRFITTADPITITYGTDSTATDVITFSLTGQFHGTITIEVKYTASDNKIVIICGTSFTADSGTVIYGRTDVDGKVTTVSGYSTVSALGNPTYIDCDIGEAYMIKNGEIITLNDTVALGSDLPTLPSGDTEVTYDNTITKVEVKPNWWKV